MKTWCKHIRWEKWLCDGVYWTMFSESINVPITFKVPRSWKLCPICEKRRPTRKKQRIGLFGTMYGTGIVIK